MEELDTPTALIDTMIGRRAAIVGMGAAGLAALTACASTSSAASAGAAASNSSAATSNSSAASASSSAATSSAPAASSSAPAAGSTIVALADVPVGGSVSAKDGDGKPIVVAQPTAGTVVAFTAICTHQGCTVKPAGKEFHCPCHGSKYDAATGKVLGGPAPQALAAIPVHVAGGNIVAGA